MAVFADELGSRSVAGGLENEGRVDWYFGTVGVASSKKLKPQLAQELDRSPFSLPVV